MTIDNRTMMSALQAGCLVTVLLLAGGCSEPSSTATEEATATAPPVETAEPAEPAEPADPAESAGAPGAVPATAADGESVYRKVCMSCHNAGIANAPKLGDTAAWAPRIAKGEDALFQSVKNGLNAMPPNGACSSCTDSELRSAVLYMVEQSS